MALTKISTGGVKDDAASQAIIADEAVDEARLQISNAGSNGQFLQKTGNTGGLTWASVPAGVGGAVALQLNDSVKIKLGTHEEYEIYNDTSNLIIDQKADGLTTYIRSKQNGNITFDASDNGNQVAAKFKWSNDSTPVSSAELYYGGVKKAETTAAGVTVSGTVTDDKGNVRSIPSNAQGSAHVATAADAGKAIYISTGGVTINNSVFSAGDAVTIINNSGSDQTITQGSGVTIHNSADAATGNRTLAGRGMATVWFASASVAYISGAGLS